MRKAIGLEQPERSIGHAAHDFATLSAGTARDADPRAEIGRRADRCVALAATTAATGKRSWARNALRPERDYVRPRAALGDPGEPQRMKRPAPTPPVAARPHRAFGHRHRDLGARSLRHLRQAIPEASHARSAGCRNRPDGTRQRRAQGAGAFRRRLPGELPPDAALQLVNIADEVFAANWARRKPRSPCGGRVSRCGARGSWKRNASGAAPSRKSRVEIDGGIAVSAPGGDFALRPRRPHRPAESGGAAILDYKTGAPPERQARCASILAPQLPLEGAMLAAGGFKDLGTTPDRSDPLSAHSAAAAEAGKLRTSKSMPTPIAQRR